MRLKNAEKFCRNMVGFQSVIVLELETILFFLLFRMSNGPYKWKVFCVIYIYNIFSVFNETKSYATETHDEIFQRKHDLS